MLTGTAAIFAHQQLKKVLKYWEAYKWTEMSHGHNKNDSSIWTPFLWWLPGSAVVTFQRQSDSLITWAVWQRGCSWWGGWYNWQVADSTTVCLLGLWNCADQRLAPCASWWMLSYTWQFVEQSFSSPTLTCFHFKTSSCFFFFFFNYFLWYNKHIIYSSVIY